MKNTKKLLSLLLVVVMLAAMLSACTKPADPKPSAPVEPTAPVETGAPTGDAFNLNLCIASEPQSIDPAINSAVDGAIMIQHMFEGLMKWQNSGVAVDAKVDAAELVPGQAKDFTKVVNEDGTATYTFNLRDDIFWSDGKPVTASDFVYSWQRLATPATAADYNYMIDAVIGFAEIAYGTPTGEFEDAKDENGEVIIDEETGEPKQNEIMAYADPTTLGVSAPDEKTFVVNLTNDLPYFLEICAFPATLPVREDMIAAKGDQWTFDTATYIGNGAYKMSAWNHNSEIVMVPNEHYYDVANLGPDSITFKLMDNNNAMLSGYKSGELDFIEDMPVDEIAGLLNSGELNISDYIGTYYVCFQTQKAPFDNPLVRQAFTLAVDRTYIVEQVTQTGQVEAGGFVPAGVYDAAGSTGDDFRTTGGDYYDPAQAAYEANCAKAKELLAEAGYPEGKDFPVVEYLYNTSDAHKAVGEALQFMWEDVLGVTVQLNNQEWNTFLQTRKDGNYSIARNGWIADYNDPMSFLDMWLTGGGNNDAQYKNPAYDELINKAKATAVAEERMDFMHQAENIIIGQDFALCPLYFYTQKYMLNDRVDNAYYTPLGYYFFMYATAK